MFLGKTLAGETITIWGDGSVARDYFHIRDLVAAFVAAIEKKTTSRIYNIGGGRSHTLMELIEAIHRISGKTPRVEFTASRKLDVQVSCLDISRAEREVGWRPHISLEEGIELTWACLRAPQPPELTG